MRVPQYGIPSLNLSHSFDPSESMMLTKCRKGQTFKYYIATIYYLDLVFSISSIPPQEFSVVLAKHCCAKGAKTGNSRLQAPRESIFRNHIMLFKMRY